jgi:Zn-finger protein
MSCIPVWTPSLFKLLITQITSLVTFSMLLSVSHGVVSSILGTVKVLYSCLDAFVVQTSDYSEHLIRHLLNASEAFPAEWFLQFWEQIKVLYSCLDAFFVDASDYSDHLIRHLLNASEAFTARYEPGL